MTTTNLNSTGFTDNLRTKLSSYMAENTSSLYKIEKGTGIHRQCIKSLLKGGGMTYENGMKLKKFISNELKFAKETEFKSKPIDAYASSSSE